jgi:hypothetical protein
MPLGQYSRAMKGTVIFAIAALAIAAPSAFADDVAGLLEKAQVLRGACFNDTSAAQTACAEEEKVSKLLEAAGWVYGYEPTADQEWPECANYWHRKEEPRPKTWVCGEVTGEALN